MIFPSNGSPMSFPRFPAIVFCCFYCLLFGACTENPLPQGTVARVNNQVITLSMLEARHDFDFIATSGNRMPTLEELEEQYAQSLTSLIIQALVDQYLEKNKLSVTPEELTAEEEKIRADYSPGDFEKVLIEDYVDLDVWREFLRQDIARRNLNEKILRPAITVSAEEMEQYYSANAKKFNKPARLRILVVESPDKRKLETLREEYLASKDIQVFEGKDGVMLHTINPQPAHLPKEMREAIRKLPPGGVTIVTKPDEAFPYNVYQLMVFRENIPAKNMTLPEVYPQVEGALVEQKLEAVFQDWLEHELSHSTIEIANPLAKIVTIVPDELRRRAYNSRIKEDSLVPETVEPPASMDGPAPEQESVPLE